MSHHYEHRYITRDSLAEQVERILITLRPLACEYNYIVVQGMSGVIPGSIVAHELGKQLIVIRKDGEQTHGFPVVAPEGVEMNGQGPWIFLDDFVANGNTLSRVLQWAALYKWPLPHRVLLYSSGKRLIDAPVPLSHRPAYEYQLRGELIAGGDVGASLYKVTFESKQVYVFQDWHEADWTETTRDWYAWRAGRPKVPVTQ